MFQMATASKAYLKPARKRTDLYGEVTEEDKIYLDRCDEISKYLIDSELASVDSGSSTRNGKMMLEIELSHGTGRVKSSLPYLEVHWFRGGLPRKVHSFWMDDMGCERLHRFVKDYYELDTDVFLKNYDEKAYHNK